jgi:lambda repressor-like predicted transcriptional regulator
MRKPSETYVKRPYVRNIKIRLAEMDMNVSDLARKMELDPRSVHGMLTQGRPWSKNWEVMADVLGLPLTEIAEIGVYQRQK